MEYCITIYLRTILYSVRRRKKNLLIIFRSEKKKIIILLSYKEEEEKCIVRGSSWLSKRRNGTDDGF